MRKITPLTWLLAGLVTALAIVFAGCSTEDPWNPTASNQLNLSLVSGPSDSAGVPTGNQISYSWTSSGGVAPVQYQWRLDGGTWSALTRNTFVTIPAPADTGAHTFELRAQDAANHSDQLSAVFLVSEVVVTDDIPPTVTIVQSPAESSFIATGSELTFSWQGADSLGTDALQYMYEWAGTVSGPTPATSVSFTNVAAADTATFKVWALDAAGNVSDTAMVFFTIKDASILWVDDYQWLDAFGNVDQAKERDQKNFYRQALEGYAFAEWDIALQGMPDSASILNYSTVIFASDTYLGDASGTWWYEVGSVGGGVVKYYMDNGGKLLIAGANTLQWLYNTNPPMPGDLEYDWLGIDSTLGWDYWQDFTWAVNAGNFPELPDSMKIDVAKNGDQVDYAEDIFAFRDSVVVLYVKGLDIDGAEPADYGNSIGHIFYPDGGEARSAMLNFDAYSMPLADIRTTFRVILTEFGE